MVTLSGTLKPALTGTLSFLKSAKRLSFTVTV